MIQQEQLDQIVRDFCAFVVRQPIKGVSRVHLQEMDGYVVGKIEEETGGAAIELWSEQGQITIVYSQTHWHIDPDGTPEQMAQLVREMEQTCEAIMEGKLLTYSVWQGERPLGGSSLEGTVEKAVQEGMGWFPNATTIYVKQWGQSLITYHHAKDAQ